MNLIFSRLVADMDGGSKFVGVEIPVSMRDFAPPALPFGVSPIPMWIFVLRGEMQFEATDGGARRIVPGSALLLEDTMGKGHVSRVLGDEDVTLAVVRLAA